MKRLFIMFYLTTLICQSVVGQSTNFSNSWYFPYCLYGWREDVNEDKSTDTQDVLQVYEYIQKTEGNFSSVDVNADKVADTQDVLRIYECMLGEPLTYSHSDPSVDVIKAALDVLDYYNALLTTTVQVFSIFLPTDDQLLTYIDPVSIGQQQTQIWKFKINPNATNPYNRIMAVVYKAEQQDDGTWVQTDSLRTVIGNSKNDQIYNRMEEILRNGIVNDLLVNGKHYYKTLANTFIRIDGQLDKAGEMTVSGGWQLDTDKPGTVNKIKSFVNGKYYITDTWVTPTCNSVADVLASNDDFSMFYEILSASGLLARNNPHTRSSSISDKGNLTYIPGNNSEGMRLLLNRHHYTLYVPTNAAMDEAFEKGLPTIEMLDDAYESNEYDENTGMTKYDQLCAVIRNFVKYHIQTEAVFAEEDEIVRKRSSTAKTNPVTGTPYKLQVDCYDGKIIVTDISSGPQQVAKDKMYNKIAREYWLDSNYPNSAQGISNTSTVVMHAINHPLLYKYYNAAGADLTLPENNQFIYSANDIYKTTEE